LKIVDADLFGRVHVPAWLREQRRHVTGRAVCFSVENYLAASGGCSVEAAFRRRGRSIAMAAASVTDNEMTLPCLLLHGRRICVDAFISIPFARAGSLLAGM
jgi:hypothetical protein